MDRKLGGRKFTCRARFRLGATNTPSLVGSFAGLGMGRPVASIPLAQLTAANGAVRTLFPVGPVNDKEVAVSGSLHQQLAAVGR